MKKSSVFSIVCCFSVCLLATQVLILRTLLQKEKKVEKTDKNHIFIARIMNLSFKYNVPLFLTDPKVFKRFYNQSDVKDDCSFLCDSEKFLHLATIGSLSTQIEKNAFIEAIEVEEYKVMQLKGSDPVLLQHGLSSPILLHLIISTPDVTIHVSVFYERPAKFWWSGGYPLSDQELHELYEMGIKNQDLSLITQSAAYNKVEIHAASINQVKIYVPLEHAMFTNFPQFHECNYSQAQSFHEKYGRDESDEAEIFRTKAWKLLAKVTRLLDNLNIPFWLSSGTCLGFYRECGFISYSKDVDIGIWIKDFNPKLISSLSTHDLPLTHSFGKVEDSYELSFRDNDLKLDIFFFYEAETYVWNGGTQARSGKKYKYIFPKFDLCWTEFLELKVRVPCKTEDYIKANYGSKWFEPVKVWDWKSSPPNVLENGVWPLDEWPEVIQLLPLPEQT